MIAKTILISALIAYAEARFGQEQVPIQAIGEVQGGAPGQAQTIAGAAISDLLGAANACDKLVTADQIVADLGGGADAIAAAIGMVTAEKNTNPALNNNAQNVCADPTLPATPELRGITPLIDPAVDTDGVAAQLSADSAVNPLNADGLSVFDIMVANGAAGLVVGQDANGDAVAGDAGAGNADAGNADAGNADAGNADAGNADAGNAGANQGNEDDEQDAQDDEEEAAACEAQNGAAANETANAGNADANQGNEDDEQDAQDDEQDAQDDEEEAAACEAQNGAAANETANAGNDQANAGQDDQQDQQGQQGQQGQQDQQDQGNADNNQAAAGGAGEVAGLADADFGLCTPTIIFEGGQNGRPADEFTFQIADELARGGQQEALNPTIIVNALCNQLTNVCEANDAAVSACEEAAGQVDAQQRNKATADAFNAALGFAGAVTNPSGGPDDVAAARMMRRGLRMRL